MTRPQKGDYSAWENLGRCGLVLILVVLSFVAACVNTETAGPKPYGYKTEEKFMEGRP